MPVDTQHRPKSIWICVVVVVVVSVNMKKRNSYLCEFNNFLKPVIYTNIFNYFDIIFLSNPIVKKNKFLTQTPIDFNHPSESIEWPVQDSLQPATVWENRSTFAKQRNPLQPSIQYHHALIFTE